MTYQMIEGDTGGKGGGGGGNESPNTLQENTIVSLLHLVGEGEIGGLATGDGQSIFVNGVPLMADANTFNFSGANYTFLNGTANQAYIPGFANVSSVIDIGEQVFHGTPVVYTVSATNIDALKVIFELPQGLKSIDGSGNINGANVQMLVEVKPHSSNAWTSVYNVQKYGKTDSAYEWTVPVTRPTAAHGALWDIRVTRVSADDASIKNVSVVNFVSVVEVQEVKLQYNGKAICGMSLNAQQFGVQIPTISFLVKGLSVKIPSNYNPVTRVYTGVWDGTFTTGFTNNPAWCLYDLLTNTTYGAGVYGMSEDSIDKFSFYNAGVFCDVQVPSGITGQTEPRFTFDAVIQQRGDALSTALMIAGMMNGNLFWANGLLVLNQDRPTDPKMPITKYNINEPGFEYVGTPSNLRTTGVNMAFQDTSNYYKPKFITQSNTAAANVYGYNAINQAAYGATSEGQAIRAAKWILFTNQVQTETVNFSMGLNGLFPTVGDVIDVFDEDYADVAGAGKIISATSNTVRLDHTVTISGAHPVIKILLPDGQTYQSYNVTTAANTTTANLTISGTFAQTPQQFNDFIVIGAVQPRTFRVVDIKQGSADNIVDYQAILYNKGNYALIENGIALPNAVYAQTTTTAIGNPANVSIVEYATNVQQGESIRRNLALSWDNPTVGVATGYAVRSRFNSGAYSLRDDILGNGTDFTNLAPGDYDFIVYSENAQGQRSTGNGISYTIAVGGGNTSALLAPTNFTILGSGNVYAQSAASMQWTNPAGNQPANTGVTLMDFRVDILDATFSTVLNTYIVKPVANSANQSFLYTFDENGDDYGNPSRNINARVYCRDTAYNLSPATSAIFQNPAPNTMTGSVTASSNAVFVQLNLPVDKDLSGVMIWRGTSNTFTPNTATKIYDGLSSGLYDDGVTFGVTYSYKWAAYDSFFAANKSDTGTGLNISGNQNVTPNLPGVAGGASLPGSANEGDIWYNTTDGQLYRWHSGAWTAAVPTSGLSGQIVTTQIANNSISTPLLQANSVTSNNITANSVGANQLIANSVVAGKINAFAVTTGTIAVGAITSTTIASGAVTTSKLAILSNNGATIDLSNGTATFLSPNGSFMSAIGAGFGSNSQFVNWAGNTPAAADLDLCTESAAIYYIKTNGDAFFGGSIRTGLTHFYSNASGTETVPAGYTQCVIEVWGQAGPGGHGFPTFGVGGGGGAGGYARTFINVVAGQTFSYNTTGTGGSCSGSTITTMSCTGGQPGTDATTGGSPGGAGGLGGNGSGGNITNNQGFQGGGGGAGADAPPGVNAQGATGGEGGIGSGSTGRGLGGPPVVVFYYT